MKTIVAAAAPRVRAIAVAALACGSVSSHAATVAFDCAPEPKVTVRFVDDRAEVTVHRRAGRAPPPRVLEQQPWASGFKYAGEGLVLVGKGNRIDLTSDAAAEAPRHCRAMKRQSGR